jgi:predicted RNA-binding protein YlxR (DUF448 family)
VERVSRAAADREGPVRTCAGCLQREAQPRLLRLVLAEGRVVADARRRRPGRGAYLHRAPTCVERAVRRGGFARAFRTSLPAAAFADAAGWLADPMTGSREHAASERS